MRSTIRSSIATMAILGATVLAAGCDTSQAAPSAGVPAVEGAEQELQTARQATRKALQASKDYAYAARDEFVKDRQNELATINKTLQQLSDKVERSGDKAKADAKARLVVLRDQAARVNGELEKVRSAPEAAWDQVKVGFNKSHDELRESVAQARTWLSEKIAP